MVKTLPDKWIRKEISAQINNISVDGFLIPCFDQRVTRNTNSDMPAHYVLMTTQSNTVDKATKCEHEWESEILLDIVTSYDLPGNPGTRLLADNILDAVRAATNDLTIDLGSGLKILRQTLSFPSDITSSTSKENIFRKFLRLEFYIT